MLIAFDFDGTLADTYPIFREAFDEAARVVHATAYRRADEAHIRTLEAADVLRYHDVPPQETPRFIELLRKGMEARQAEARLFEGIPEALEELRRSGHACGLISSNSDALLRATLGELFGVFAHCWAEISLTAKTEALRRAAAEWAPGAHMYYVGDEVRDVRAAHEAGVPFAAVTWGYNTEAALREAGCQRFVRAPRELAGLPGTVASVAERDVRES